MSDVVSGVRQMQVSGGTQFVLNQTLLAWKNIAIDYENQTMIASTSEANYKIEVRRIKRELVAKNPKITSARAQEMAESEENMLDAYFEYKVEEARLDGMKVKLKWLEAEVGRLRSLVVTERGDRQADSFTQPG